MNFNNIDNSNKNDILGYRIKEARIARGYTADELAKKLVLPNSQFLNMKIIKPRFLWKMQ